MVFMKDLKEKGVLVSMEKLQNTKTAVHIMNNDVVSALEKGGAKEEVELWHIYREYLDGVFEIGGKD